MDLSADSRTLPTHTIVGGPVLEHELSLSSAHSQKESGGTILLQLLEFKTHLLEAVEELHIRRDAETRFEDQISKLVLEKQELEWEKESLQHQTESMANQHAESLINVNKQFQAKIRNIEELKGKYKVSAELKDKEINNLKEELKSLQLLKYNLEKKSSELEQKLALQSRSKDSHLNQLGEVEKRFSALSRQCALVKQTHEKLEQNVDEAMKRNKKLTSANQKQETMIMSLKKELEEVSNKLIKAKMSSVRDDKRHCPAGIEQHARQLHQKLNLETEMSKKLRVEIVAVRAEKQEVMKSLQHTQQLLLSQTQTVSRVELELQAQREQYQALKQEHEVMREKSQATEDKVAQLMESYAASKTSWDKEKAMFLDHIKSEQQGHLAVKEAYDELHHKHAELSSQAKVQHIHELEMRHCNQNLSVSTKLFPTVVEEIRGEQTLNEPICSSEPPGFGSLQRLASTQTKEPDCLQDTRAVTKLVATGSTEGLDNQYHLQQSQNPSNSNTFSLWSIPETTDSVSSILNNITHSHTCQSEPDVVLDFRTSSSSSDDGLLKSKGGCLSDTVSSAGHMPVDGFVDSLCKERSDEGMGEKEQEWKDDANGRKNKKEEKINEEPRWNREEVQGNDVEEGGSAGEKRGTSMAQTTDTADRQEDSQRSTEDARDTKQPETETKDRAEGEGTDGAEERGKTGPHTPEKQIVAQTTTDTTSKKSDAQQVIDSVDTELPLVACELTDCPQSLSQQVSEKVSDSSHLNKGHEVYREAHTFCSDDHRSVSHGSNSVKQHVYHEVNTFYQDLPRQVPEKTTAEKPANKSEADIPTEPNLSGICSSQTNTPAVAAQLHNIVSIKEKETTATQIQHSHPSDTTSSIKQDEMCDVHVSEDAISPQAVHQSQEISERERGQLRSLVPNDENDDSSVYKKGEGQSNFDTCEKDPCETAQEHLDRSNGKDACVDTVDTVDLESEVETESCQEHIKHDKIKDPEAAKMTRSDVRPSHENNALAETSSTKYYQQSPAKEILLEDAGESSVPRNKPYRASFDWGSTQRKAGSSSTKFSVSVLHQLVQGSPVSEQNTSGNGGLLRHPSSTIPIKSKHSNVPLVITRASDLLNASSVSGTAASSRRHQQGELKAVGETRRETAATDTETRTSLSISYCPGSTSSVTDSRTSLLTTSGLSRAPTSAAGLSSESDWEPSSSQEREDQQSSFRAQINKIEQFLKTERLHLPKRRKTDN